MQGSPSFLQFVRSAWVLWAMGLVFALGIFLSTLSSTKGAHGLEIGLMLAAGILEGGVIRSLVRARWVTIVLVLVVAMEGLLLSFLADPWSYLWPVLVPASAIGVMVGNVVRLGIRDSKRTVVRNAWDVNGVEQPSSDAAKRVALAALSSWDSAGAGRFLVERNEALFEAMGSRATGFIVHCAANSREAGEWRILGSVDTEGETEVRIPSGPAHAPSGVVVDLETAARALRGFFHHRGPAPELAWTAGDAVFDLKFG